LTIDDSGFGRSTDMMGPQKFKMGHVTLITAILGYWGVVCHPWARTCYAQPTYRIWTIFHGV